MNQNLEGFKNQKATANDAVQNLQGLEIKKSRKGMPGVASLLAQDGIATSDAIRKRKSLASKLRKASLQAMQSFKNSIHPCGAKKGTVSNSRQRAPLFQADT